MDFMDVFARELDAFLSYDIDATSRLIATSLSAKKAIVEFDEFELDLRRSMNYGHSFGHALEALTNYKISHGVGVAIGILVENEISFYRKLLSKSERDYLLALGSKIIHSEALNIFKAVNLNGIIDLLRRDKKAEGAILKLATIESIGQMRFIDFSLDDSGEQELRNAVTSVIKAIS
jgi:3-dehydroquinate synthase